MKVTSSPLDYAKEAAAKAAVELIQDGMVVGLGTGSTAERFIAHLIERCRKGLRIQAAASSRKSFEQASAGGISMANIDELLQIDLTVDGADEIDRQKRMIKGGGGALLREKIIASMSREMVVIVDETKLVDRLGAHPLPVEIVPFAFKATAHKLEQLGYQPVLRQGKDGVPYLTDNNNYILDLHLKELCDAPDIIEGQIRRVVGVVETGLFLNLAGRVFVGYSDGHVVQL